MPPFASSQLLLLHMLTLSLYLYITITPSILSFALNSPSLSLLCFSSPSVLHSITPSPTSISYSITPSVTPFLLHYYVIPLLYQCVTMLPLTLPSSIHQMLLSFSPALPLQPFNTLPLLLSSSLSHHLSLSAQWLLLRASVQPCNHTAHLN